ncbi:MAG: EcoRV family type II restriction endonuclease [Paludibacteraceae bacterium]|nr:EcoRV family type II restriction endonuclease [Paludibacteraceae bacterium]
MEKETFIKLLKKTVEGFDKVISTEDGNWVVKGFVDVYKNVYTISTDTKVISKIIELYLFPKILEFATQNGLKVELTKAQNYYPDITLKDEDGNLFAVDLKSSYRKDETHINGMTLGAFTGYFRERKSSKNVTYPYDDYKAHIVLGVIYDTVADIDERKSYTLEQIGEIVSVIKNFQFFVQEKWRIAIDRPGSGNTKNIGSVSKIEDLINGNGVFAELGEDVFNDYWMYYLTSDMAKKAELPQPYYTNLAEYKRFKHME